MDEPNWLFEVSRKIDYWAWHRCWSTEDHQFIAADYQQEKFPPHWGCTHTVQPGSDLKKIFGFVDPTVCSIYLFEEPKSTDHTFHSRRFACIFYTFQCWGRKENAQGRCFHNLWVLLRYFVVICFTELFLTQLDAFGSSDPLELFWSLSHNEWFCKIL